jgi:ankyrin repeat protein
MSSAEKRFFIILFSVITVVIAVFIGLFLYGKVSSETRAEAYAERYQAKKELHAAVVKGDYEGVESLLTRYPEIVNLPLSENTEEYGKSLVDDTPLIAAGADLKMISLLLSHGADPNVPSPINGRYPLAVAVSSRSSERYEAAQLYIDAGADVTLKDGVFGSMLLAALSVNAEKGAENVLRQVGAKDVTEYMVERGVSLAIDSNGNSALGFALKNNLYIAAEYIIRSGKIDLNAPVDGEGRPPLSAALYYNQYDIADLLFDRGADVNKADKNGNTPIMYAVITAKKDRVKQFVDEGADVGAVNNQGKSVISFVMTLDISDAQKADMVKILDGRG